MSENHEKALAIFTDYFVKNYPGPDTVIFNPVWHAPKIFRAALHAVEASASKFPEGFFDDRFEKPVDTDTPVQAAAREAGWALSSLVDEIKFEKRQQVVNIINSLSAALAHAERGQNLRGALGEGAVCHLVWEQGRIAIDDVVDYYEVATADDKSVDGSDPFPVYAKPQTQALAIKALEWKYLATPPSGEEYASSPFGTYYIELGFRKFTLKVHSSNFGDFETLDAAKEFAKADYETRVRAALVSDEGQS